MNIVGLDTAFIPPLAPASMIFIPCKDGIGHNEIEDAKPEHITSPQAATCCYMLC
jgi:N-carbamoyl-L-amino-acid hydrolase